MKKKIIIAIIILVIAALVIPVPMRLKDGGTVKYQSVLYSISDVHRLASSENDVTYEDGIIIEILGFEIFNNVKMPPVTEGFDVDTTVDDPESELSSVVYDAELSYAGTPLTNKIYLNSINRDKLRENVRHLPVYKIETKSDLEGFKLDFADELTMDSGYDEIPSFEEVTNKYTNDFFEESTLFIIYIDSTNSTHRYGIESIFNDDGYFSIYLEETTKAESVDTAMAGWFMTVSVSRESVAECIEFDAILNYGYDIVGHTASEFREAPKLIVTLNESEIVALKGTSSWTYTDEYGEGVSVMSDSSHPLLLKEHMPALTLVPVCYVGVYPLDARLQFGASPNVYNPDSVSVSCWPVECWEGTDSKSEDIPVYTENGNIYIALKDGDYIYEVTAEWDDSRSAHGLVNYSFYTSKP